MARDSMNDQMIEEVSGIFGALGDASRLRILRALLASQTALSQGGVSEQTGLSQANSSKHLGYLVRAGLVNREQKGNTVYFSIGTPLVEQMCHLVCDHVAERIKVAFHAIGR